jgi:hypothetical protein
MCIVTEPKRGQKKEKGGEKKKEERGGETECSIRSCMLTRSHSI